MEAAAEKELAGAFPIFWRARYSLTQVVCFLIALPFLKHQLSAASLRVSEQTRVHHRDAAVISSAYLAPIGHRSTLQVETKPIHQTRAPSNSDGQLRSLAAIDAGKATHSSHVLMILRISKAFIPPEELEYLQRAI